MGMSRLDVHEPTTTADKIADGIAGFIGTLRFLVIQTVLVAIWIGANVIEAAWRPWDPYPFILLNLLFSVQAAYTGPILQLTGNRQAFKDRQIAMRDDEEIGLLLE